MSVLASVAVAGKVAAAAGSTASAGASLTAANSVVKATQVESLKKVAEAATSNANALSPELSSAANETAIADLSAQKLDLLTGKISPEQVLSPDNFFELNKLKAETGWTNNITNTITNSRQLDIYKNAELKELQIDGRDCLVRKVDWDYVDDESGLTNRERASRGLSPIDSNTGEKIQLHHMGQKFDSPFAELSATEHGDGNYSVLHRNSVESWRRNPDLRTAYNDQRISHWKLRSEMAA